MQIDWASCNKHAVLSKKNLQPGSGDIRTAKTGVVLKYSLVPIQMLLIDMWSFFWLQLFCDKCKDQTEPALASTYSATSWWNRRFFKESQTPLSIFVIGIKIFSSVKTNYCILKLLLCFFQKIWKILFDPFVERWKLNDLVTRWTFVSPSIQKHS